MPDKFYVPDAHMKRTLNPVLSMYFSQYIFSSYLPCPEFTCLFPFNHFMIPLDTSHVYVVTTD